MDDNTYTFELIERYLSNDLPPQELESFEERLKADESFAKEVEKQRLTHKATDIYAQLKTKEKVKERYDEVLKSDKNNRRAILSIAATIAIFLIAGIGFFVPFNYSSEALADANFEAFPDRITTMGTATDDQLAAGMKAYNESNFEEAIELFSNLPETLPQKDLVKLYSGISFMETNQLEKATKAFQQLISSNSPQAEVAQWYLALNFLKSKDTENAKLQLNQIVVQNGYQSKSAALLLKNLDNPVRKLPWVH